LKSDEPTNLDFSAELFLEFLLSSESDVALLRPKNDENEDIWFYSVIKKIARVTSPPPDEKNRLAKDLPPARTGLYLWTL
jgi:hypothetical protein